MNELWSQVVAWATHHTHIGYFVAAGVLVGGLLLSYALTVLLGRFLQAKGTPQQAALIPRITRYILYVITVLVALDTGGVDLRVFLGAAGVATVAVGFAAKTAASNIISGIFLIGERPFKIGDVVTVGVNTGEIVSIDLMSVRMRTFDNIMVRIPNETILRSEISTLSHYPIRRVDMPFTLAFDADIRAAHAALEQVALDNPKCLTQPAAQLHFLGFVETGVNLRFSVWCAYADLVPLRLELAEQALAALHGAGVPVARPERRVTIEGSGAAG